MNRSKDRAPLKLGIDEHRLGVAQSVAGLLDESDFITGAVFSVIEGIKKRVARAESLEWIQLWSDIERLEEQGPDFERNASCLLLMMAWNEQSGLDFQLLDRYAEIMGQQFPSLSQINLNLRDENLLIKYLTQLQTHDSTTFEPKLVQATLNSL